MTRADIQTAIHDFVLDKFPSARSIGLATDGGLLDQGIVDSLGVLEIVLFIQSRFEVHFDDEEMLPENFHSISALTELVHRKRGLVAP